MNDNQLLQFVRTLAERDPKTLSQKTLKAGEEFGELAKKALPFDNAAATTHRFVQKRDILEECADLMLCALSIAYDLGFEDDDVKDMMWAKAEKWASLQAREAGVKYPVPYEIHVTVESSERETFQKACQELEVKPIVLALQGNGGGTVLHDVMTSSVHLGDNRTASAEVERIAAGLAERGLTVVRRKIETVPWHPAAPCKANGVQEMPKDCYFESHLNTIVRASSEEESARQRSLLGHIAKAHGAHLSRNAFKLLSDSAYTLMLTLRSYDKLREDFEVARDALATHLHSAGFEVEKVITEFSVFDTKVSHDVTWLKAA